MQPSIYNHNEDKSSNLQEIIICMGRMLRGPLVKRSIKERTFKKWGCGDENKYCET